MIAVASFAQSTTNPEPPTRVRFGIKGGLNLANISNNNDGSTDKDKTLAAWHAGLIVDLPLSPILSLQPGVFYSSKGSKIERGSSGSVTDPYYKFTTNPQYIEIPVNFVMKVPLGDDRNKFFAGIGPYAAFGVAGKNKWKSSLGSVSASGSSSIKWDDDSPLNTGDSNQGYDKYKRFDWGGNVMVGLELSNFLVSAEYGLGFNKIYSGTDDQSNDNGKNRVFRVSVGYLF
ncbi:MAG TPA: porin family protein [Chitinophaga sp.]